MMPISRLTYITSGTIRRSILRKIFSFVLYHHDSPNFYFDPDTKATVKSDWINRCDEFLKTYVVTGRIDKDYHWNEIDDEGFSCMTTRRTQGNLVFEVKRI